MCSLSSGEVIRNFAAVCRVLPYPDTVIYIFPDLSRYFIYIFSEDNK